ncbi:MAG: hypothetical protein ABW189_08825 [Rickettsiales bacterium]
MHAIVFWTQRLFFFSALMLLCVVLFAFFAPIFISSDSLKNRVQKDFLERTGMRLAVNGDAKISFFPKVKISLKDVRLLPNEARLGEVRTPLSVREATIETGLGTALLGGAHSKFDAITLQSPSFYVRRIDMEDYDWDTLARGETSPLESGALWQTLYDLCRGGDAPFEEWKSGAEKKAKRLVEGNRTAGVQFQEMIVALCKDAPEVNRFVRYNWEMLGPPGKGGGAASAEKKSSASENAQEKWLEAISSVADTIDISNAAVAYEAFDKEYSVDMVSATISPGSQDAPFDVEGSIQGSRISVGFGAHLDAFAPKEDAEFFMEAKGVFTVKWRGNTVTLPSGNVGAEGTLSGKINNFSELSSIFEEESLFSKIAHSKGATIEAALSFNDNGLEAKNITIDSDAIKGAGSTSLEYEESREADWKWKTDFSFSLIDLDALFFARPEDEDEDMYYDSAFTGNQFSLELPELFSFNASITVAEIVFHNERIRDFVLYMDALRHQAVLHRFEFAMPGNSLLSLTGSVEHNGVRPLFKGFVTAHGQKLRDMAIWMMPELADYVPADQMKDFSFDAKLQLTPVSMMVDEAMLSFDNASVRGSYGVDYIDSSSAQNIAVYLDRIDFDRYGLTALILKKMRDIEDSQFADGAALESYIRNLTKQMHLTAECEDVIFNDHRLRYADMLASYAPGKFDVEKFSVQDDETVANKKINFSSSLSLEVGEDSTPHMDLTVKSSDFDLNFFLDSNADIAAMTRQSSIPYFFLDRFNGNALVSMENIFYNRELAIKNLYIKGSSKDRIFSMEDLRLILANDAKMVAKGMFSLTHVVSAGVSFSGRGFDVAQLYGYFSGKPKEESPYQGLLNAEGSVQANGENVDVMLKKMRINAKFVVDKLTVEHLDLYKIFYALANTISVVDMKKAIEEGLNKGSTDFTSAKGNVTTDEGGEANVLRIDRALFSTPYSRSLWAVNYGPASNQLRSVFNTAFRPAPNAQLSLSAFASGKLGQNMERSKNDDEIINYVTSKTEGLH